MRSLFSQSRGTAPYYNLYTPIGWRVMIIGIISLSQLLFLIEWSGYKRLELDAIALWLYILAILAFVEMRITHDSILMLFLMKRAAHQCAGWWASGCNASPSCWRPLVKWSTPLRAHRSLASAARRRPPTDLLHVTRPSASRLLPKSSAATIPVSDSEREAHWGGRGGEESERDQIHADSQHHLDYLLRHQTRGGGRTSAGASMRASRARQ